MSATECKGLPAISGGKPLLQAKGLQSCVDTNGVSDLSFGKRPFYPSPGRLRFPYRIACTVILLSKMQHSLIFSFAIGILTDAFPA
jgi:hypothetical protein